MFRQTKVLLIFVYIAALSTGLTAGSNSLEREIKHSTRDALFMADRILSPLQVHLVSTILSEKSKNYISSEGCDIRVRDNGFVSFSYSLEGLDDSHYDKVNGAIYISGDDQVIASFSFSGSGPIGDVYFFSQNNSIKKLTVNGLDISGTDTAFLSLLAKKYSIIVQKIKSSTSSS